MSRRTQLGALAGFILGSLGMVLFAVLALTAGAPMAMTMVPLILLGYGTSIGLHIAFLVRRARA